MNQRLKMILGIVALFTSAGLIGFFLYFLMFRSVPVVEEEIPEEEQVVGGLEGAEEGIEYEEEEEAEVLFPSEEAEGAVIPVLLTSSPVTAPTITSDGNIAYYDPSDGRFYTIDSNGNAVALSSDRFPEAETVVFADSADVAVIEFPDGTNIIYDMATGSQTTLPSHWEDFDFSKDGESVASKSMNTDPDSRALVVTSSDGTRTEAIAALGTSASKVTLNWSPDDAVVGFSETGQVQSGLGRQQIYLIGMDGEATGAIVVEGTNFEAIWAPSGNYILYSVADSGNNYRPSLWYVNASGSNIGSDRTKFSIETWVDKCSFASETKVYCAVPREVTNFSGEDPKLVTAGDDVYLLNLATGRSVLVASPVSEIQMFNVTISPDDSVLYYTDSTGRLNFVRLD
ncbi:MAG: hypothetical protein ABIA47_03465 [bacterium]